MSFPSLRAARTSLTIAMMSSLSARISALHFPSPPSFVNPSRTPPMISETTSLDWRKISSVIGPVKTLTDFPNAVPIEAGV